MNLNVHVHFVKQCVLYNIVKSKLSLIFLCTVPVCSMYSTICLILCKRTNLQYISSTVLVLYSTKG
jgi:hypothetical protein